MASSLQHIGPAVQRATAYGAGFVALGTTLASKFSLSMQKCVNEAIGVVAFSTLGSGAIEVFLNLATGGRESARIGIDKSGACLKSLVGLAGVVVYKIVLEESCECAPREDLPYVATKLLGAAGALLISVSEPCAVALAKDSDDPQPVQERTVLEIALKGIGMGMIGCSVITTESLLATAGSTLGAFIALMRDPVTRLGEFDY